MPSEREMIAEVERRAQESVNALGALGSSATFLTLSFATTSGEAHVIPCSRWCVPIQYSGRPPGSSSKIRTLSDGYRILATLFMLLREYQPVTMGGISFLVLAFLGLIMIIAGWMRSSYYLFTGGVGLALLGAFILCTGVILHAINMANREGEEQRKKLARKNEEPGPTG